jgi:hypothetical protein
MNSERVDQIIAWDERWARQFAVRLTRGQKERFREELKKNLGDCNFETQPVSTHPLFRTRNLVTRCERPLVILLAHYDTATILPFWIQAIFKLLGHTRQISGGLLIIALLSLPMVLEGSSWLLDLFQLLLLLSLLVLLIPNPYNREDNTSGVLGLMALAHWLRNKPDLRERVQLAFLDKEEWGLLGSVALQRRWQEEGHPYQEAAIINLDCVARGQVPLIVHHGQDHLARRALPFVQEQLPAAILVNMGIVPLSDNHTFRRQGAINISFAERTLVPGGYYIPRIHTPRDNDLNPKRLSQLVSALSDFVVAEVGVEEHEAKRTRR